VKRRRQAILAVLSVGNIDSSRHSSQPIGALASGYRDPPPTQPTACHVEYGGAADDRQIITHAFDICIYSEHLPKLHARRSGLARSASKATNFRVEVYGVAWLPPDFQYRPNQQSLCHGCPLSDRWAADNVVL
jgi:hypothetical protein